MRDLSPLVSSTARKTMFLIELSAPFCNNNFSISKQNLGCNNTVEHSGVVRFLFE